MSEIRWCQCKYKGGTAYCEGKKAPGEYCRRQVYEDKDIEDAVSPAQSSPKP